MPEILLAQLLHRHCHLVTVTKTQSCLKQAAGFSHHYFNRGIIDISNRNINLQRIEDVVIVNAFSLSNYER